MLSIFLKQIIFFIKNYTNGRENISTEEIKERNINYTFLFILSHNLITLPKQLKCIVPILCYGKQKDTCNYENKHSVQSPSIAY